MDHHEPHSYMSYRNLYDIHKNVSEMLEMLNENETLEDWMEYKITTARNAISDVFSALRYEKGVDNTVKQCDHDHADVGIIKFGEWVKRNVRV